MLPVQRVIPDLVASIVRPAPLTPGKVTFAWRLAVGPAIARASSVSLEGQTLSVRCDPRWGAEISRSVPMIQDRLAAVLGPDTVRELRIFGE